MLDPRLPRGAAPPAAELCCSRPTLSRQRVGDRCRAVSTMPVSILASRHRALAAISTEVAVDGSGNDPASEERPVIDPFPSGGETRRLIFDFDWSETELGPITDWPLRLRFALGTCLESRHPIIVFWGEDLRVFYNDAYVPSMGDKHPDALGRPARESWAEIWPTIGTMFEGVMQTGNPTWADDLELGLLRHGFVEETYWTFSYSPIRDEHAAVRGVFCAVTETTDNIVATRREVLLRDVAVAATTARSERGFLAAVGRALSSNPNDIPFARLYSVEPETGQVRIVVATDQLGQDPFSRTAGQLGTGVEPLNASVLATVLATGESAYERFSDAVQPDPVPWPEPIAAGMACPAQIVGDRVSVVLGAGLSPRLPFNTRYRSFVESLAAQVGIGLSTVRAREQDRQRVQKLADLDRTKTRFLHNISHEFRTPLTLMLAPLQSVLGQQGESLTDQQREHLAIVHRAVLRQQRLVETLLDAARANENRIEARVEPTDLGLLTAELTSMFRSAAELAGLELVVDIQPLKDYVAVDREMWSKIVSNLLSNALKFTQKGAITVRLRPVDDDLELTVTDTGVGIADEHLPRIFERWYRPRREGARSPEGSGIGLSLVADLVHAQRGEVSAVSALGAGSTVTVRLPALGAAGAAPRPLDPVSNETTPFVDEALTWLRSSEPAMPSDAASGPTRGRILLVEDNADMRGYLVRLLREHNWAVDEVGNAEAALERAHAEPPDLVLSDIMLPGKDGIELVRAVRLNDSLHRIPIVLLTARAGHDAAVEGLDAGADDYVIKPFDSAELLARVQVHFELSRLREYAISQAEDRSANLEKALSSNRQIGTAIGILMALHKTTAEAAFTLLRTASQHTHRKLYDIAEEVNATGALPTPHDPSQ
jgi:signal transduction histidine kinase/DNA-binding response OmpR family regulator